jgi:hypothetical protein
MITCPNCRKRFPNGEIPVHNCVLGDKPKFYLIHVWRCAEPTLHGPYDTEKKRDKAKARLGRDDRDTVFKMDCLGVPQIR